jgi:hypothetical protein
MLRVKFKCYFDRYGNGDLAQFQRIKSAPKGSCRKANRMEGVLHRATSFQLGQLLADLRRVVLHESNTLIKKSLITFFYQIADIFSVGALSHHL